MPTLRTKLYPSLLNPNVGVDAQQLETDRRMIAFDHTIQHLNRRGFLGAMLSAAALAAVAGSSRSASAQTVTPAVTDVLNFALNLEYLEANFYLYASSGAGLTAAQNGGGPAVQGAPGKLALDAVTLATVQALALDEMNHIAGLRATITSLGGTPVAQPLMNLAAHGAVTTQAQFLTTARQFTSLGVSAYAGAAQLLVSNPAVLSVAGQILGAEGQHAGALAYLCVAQGVISPAFDAQDVQPTATQYFTVDPVHALAPARTSQQVLGVVYGVSTAATTTPAMGVSMGGFFPSGLNGAVKST